jgi:hypothetical protein
MQTVERQIKRARRRMVAQALLGRLAWCWLATLSLATAGIAAGKFWPPENPLAWNVSLTAGGLGLGALAAAVWTFWTRASRAAAAAEIDRRFQLRERISSSLLLGPDQLDSEIGQALVRDADRRAERIDIGEQFAVRLDRRALLPLAPAGVCLAVVLLVGPRVVETPAKVAAEERAQIKKSTEQLVKKLSERNKESPEIGLSELDPLLAKLERGVKDLAEKTPADRKQSLVALSELAKDVEKRREALSAAAELKDQLAQLKNLEQGPAQKMTSALKNGDLKKAIDELGKLQEKLADDKLSAQEKEQLARQLEQAQQSLEKMVDGHKQAEQELQKRLEAEQQAGNTAAAEKLQQQLDKLAQQKQQMDKLGQMAADLKQAGQALKDGKPGEAAEALGKLGEQLGDAQGEMENLATLDEALEQIAECKNAISCTECDGEGCAQCQGKDGGKLGDKWSRKDWAKGGGRGAGQREKKENEGSFVDSQVPQNVRQGAMVVKGTADGPNKKGVVQESIKHEFSDVEQQSAEALSGQRLPHDYRDHAQGYFDALRESR